MSQAPRTGVTAFYPSGNPEDGDLVLAWAWPYDSTGDYHQDPDTFEPLFQGYRIAYRDLANDTVYLSFLPQAPAVTMSAPDPSTVQSAIDPTSDRPLARGVELFQLRHPLTQDPTDQLNDVSSLRMRVVGADKRNQTLELTREMRFYY